MAMYETALSHLSVPVIQSTSTSRTATKSTHKIAIQEKRNLVAMVVRASSRKPSIVKGCTKAGYPLPAPLVAEGKLTQCLRIWISNDEFLYIFSNHIQRQKAKLALQEALQRQLYSLVDISGGYAYLLISGTARIDLFRKLSSYNLQYAFPEGKAVSTLLAKAPAILIHLNKASILVIMRFSYADYLYRLIAHAAEEFSG